MTDFTTMYENMTNCADITKSDFDSAIKTLKDNGDKNASVMEILTITKPCDGKNECVSCMSKVHKDYGKLDISGDVPYFSLNDNGEVVDDTPPDDSEPTSTDSGTGSKILTYVLIFVVLIMLGVLGFLVYRKFKN